MNNQTAMEVEVDNGRKLRVYDNIFSLQYRQVLYNYMRGSFLELGGRMVYAPKKEAINFYIHRIAKTI